MTDKSWKFVDGARRVAGCVVIHPKKHKILLVTSSGDPSKWVLPKGGIEKGETEEQAAAREVWEEAGVRGKVVRELGVWHVQKDERAHKPHKSRSRFVCYEMRLTAQEDEWPEKHRRTRRWVSYRKAVKRVKYEFMEEAIKECSLSKLEADAGEVDSATDEDESTG